MPLPRFPGALRAAAVAIVLGATALAAAPAQASSPSVSFGFSFGTGPHHFHLGHRHVRPGHPQLRFHLRHGPQFRACLTQRQLVSALNRQGYRNISFIRFGTRTVEARATRGNHRVIVVADACRGRVLEVYRAWQRR